LLLSQNFSGEKTPCSLHISKRISEPFNFFFVADPSQATSSIFALNHINVRALLSC